MVFGKILKYFSGSDNSKSRIIIEAEDADRIRISPDPLHCPICFTVFASAPAILPCGHTFCVKCVRTLIQRAIYDCPPMRTPEFECALCRSKVSAQIKICRNFIIEDILNTISIPPDEIYIENEIIKNYEVLLKRTNQQLREAEEKVSNAMGHLKILQNRLYTAVGVIGGLAAVIFVKAIY